MSNSWLPDWKDPSQYPDFEKISLNQKAWEFLRRNPKYQEDYSRYMELQDKYASRYIPQELVRQYRPTGAILIIDKEIIWPDGKKTTKYISPIKYVQRKYGLRFGLPNPALKYMDQMFGFEGACGFSYLTYIEGNKGAIAPESQNEVIMCIDFSLPDEILIKRFKNELKRIRHEFKLSGIDAPTSKRDIGSKYRDYLRVLDAYESKADVRVIATILFPNLDNIDPDYAANQKVNNYFRAAIKLRDSDYQHLIKLNV